MADQRNHDDLDLSGLTQHARMILNAEEKSHPTRDAAPPPSVRWADVTPVRGLSIAVRALLLAWVPFSLLAVAANAAQRSLLDRVASDPTSVRLSELVDDGHRIDLLNHVAIGLLVVTAAAWMAWFFVVYANLEPLGVAHRWSTGWAVGAWLVPVLCWWRPKQLADDAWEAVDRGRRAEGRDPSRAVLHAWWAAWIGAFVVAILANNANSTAQRAVRDGSLHALVDASRSANALYTARAVLLLVAAVLAWFVVGSISRAQSGPADA